MGNHKLEARRKYNRNRRKIQKAKNKQSKSVSASIEPVVSIYTPLLAPLYPQNATAIESKVIRRSGKLINILATYKLVVNLV